MNNFVRAFFPGIIFIIIFGTNAIAKESSFMKGVFTGEISNVDIKNNHVSIRSSQIQTLRQSKILYVHINGNKKEKIILFVQEILPGSIKAKVIFGNVTNIALNAQVTNIHSWNADEYLTELIYNKQGKEIQVQEKLVIPRTILFISGKEKKWVTGNNIQQMIFHHVQGNIKLKYIVLKNGEKIQSTWTNLSLPNIHKKVSLKLHDAGVFDMASNNLRTIKILGTSLRPAFRSLSLHYLSGIKIKPQNTNEQTYPVSFRFINPELIIFALESKLSFLLDQKNFHETEGLEDLNPFVQILASFEEKQIESISLLGTFNQWNETRNMLQRNMFGFYSVQTNLPAGMYEYYYLVRLRGWEQPIKILDPYANSTSLISNIFCSDYPGGKEFEYWIAKISAEQIDANNSYNQQFLHWYNKQFKIQDTAISKTFAYYPWDSKYDFSILEITPNILKKTKQKPPKKGKIDDNFKLEMEALQKTLSQHNYVEIQEPVRYITQFFYDQLPLIRPVLKNLQEQESKKETPNSKFLFEINRLLALFDEKKVKKIHLVGDFNNWKPNVHILQRIKGTTQWFLETSFPEGQYSYAFLIETQVPGSPILILPDLFQQQHIPTIPKTIWKQPIRSISKLWITSKKFKNKASHGIHE